MKKLLYSSIKIVFKAALQLYFGKISISGLENVPVNKPVLFLPNHQNALLDPLLIVIDCNRKPYFLTRSDVFTNPFLKSIFAFFQMIPIYRIRDGRDSLKNNDAVFDYCTELLCKNEAILMFPEANHNQRRRVRTLSKGFTRILFNTLDKNPELDVQIVPVGLNYRNLVAFPDKAALFYGKPIAVKNIYNPKDLRSSVTELKEIVSTRLKKLTTHIEDENAYDTIVNKLDALKVNYMNPENVNQTIENLKAGHIVEGNNKAVWPNQILKAVFTVFNLPVILLWKAFVKPKVWEPEFSGTLRFVYSLLIYPIYFLSLFIILSSLTNSTIGVTSILGLFLFNWLYARFT